MRKVKAAIGFRAKTGRAIAVALLGPADKPSFVLRQELALVDPKVPETAQPYHEVMELPWSEAASVARKFVEAIEAVATRALGTLLNELKSQHVNVQSVGIVGSLDRNLEKIGNPHIRAHAAEGMLFRHVLEIAAAAHRTPWRSFSEQTVTQCAVSELGVSRARLGSHLKTLGKDAGPPWRSEEKAAATAAWLALGR